MRDRAQHDFDISAIILPDAIRLGDVTTFHESEILESYPLLHWLFWMSHRTLGEVTPVSISNFFGFSVRTIGSLTLIAFSVFCLADQYPHFDLLHAVVRSQPRVAWKALETLFQRFAGKEGRVSWLTAKEAVLFSEPRSKKSLENSANYGLSGISDSKRRAGILKFFDGRFAPVMADYAFWSLHSRPVPEFDQSTSLDRFIDSLADDGLITSPRAQWIRRISYGRQSRISSRQTSRLLDVLIEVGCGSTKPEIVAAVLFSAMRADELSNERILAALEAIKVPKGTQYLFVPASFSEDALAYKKLLEVASQADVSAAREMRSPTPRLVD